MASIVSAETGGTDSFGFDLNLDEQASYGCEAALSMRRVELRFLDLLCAYHHPSNQGLTYLRAAFVVNWIG